MATDKRAITTKGMEYRQQINGGENTLNRIDWDNVLIQASIAAMQGIQESGKFGLLSDVVPKELAKMSVNIGQALVEELKTLIE